MSADVRSWIVERLALATLRFQLACEIGRAGLAKLHDRSGEVADRLRLAFDPDEEPCRGCGAPGGTHYDCDLPHVGTMTATARRRTFAASSAADRPLQLLREELNWPGANDSELPMVAVETIRVLKEDLAEHDRQ